MQTVLIFFILVISIVVGLPASERNPIDQLYENLLQREDIGQIGFPKHEVERKAQRSPSLRLRFGRSDPSLMNFDSHSAEKRYYNWFGDVNQKPIRSPSLRLRFGRRSDPSVSIHGPHIDPDSDRVISPNDLLPLSDVSSQSVRMLLDALKQIEEENINNNNEDEITGYYDSQNTINEEQQQQQQQQQFDRETRKPRGSQLRLRWGRSTGNVPTPVKMEKNEEKLMTSMDNNPSTNQISTSEIAVVTSANAKQNNI